MIVAVMLMVPLLITMMMARLRIRDSGVGIQESDFRMQDSGLRTRNENAWICSESARIRHANEGFAVQNERVRDGNKRFIMEIRVHALNMQGLAMNM